MGQNAENAFVPYTNQRRPQRRWRSIISVVVRKNFLVLSRNRKQTIREFAYPVLYLSILLVLHGTTGDINDEDVDPTAATTGEKGASSSSTSNPESPSNTLAIAGPIYMVLLYAIGHFQGSMIAILTEKEKDLRERLLVSGLPQWALTTSWFLTLFVKGVPLALATSFAGVVLTPETSLGVNLALNFLFLASLCSLALFASTLFRSSKLGAGVSTLLLILTGNAGVFAEEQREGTAAVLSVLPAAAFSRASVLSFGGRVVNCKTIFSGEGVSFGMCMVAILLDTVLYLLLALYLDTTLFVNSRRAWCPWSFPCRLRLWFLRGIAMPHHGRSHDCDTELMGVRYRPVDGADPSAVPAAESLEGMEAGQGFSEAVEPVDADMAENVGVSIQGLRKTYKSTDGSPIHAVDDLNLDLYNGQVTSLLGPNAAGKSTLLSVLTGMTDATSGNAHIYGLSVHDQMDEIRLSVGICTQHDLLWDELTVLEHLRLFAEIRGRSDPDAEASSLAVDVGLGDDLNVRSDALSGGTKRKLSVAIALVGDPKVVLLDEPTAGLDPQGRRQLWNVVSRMKVGRTVLLTTHHMDEADLLGDRIAILDRGRLRVCGSSMYLKRKFGVGYRLSVQLNGGSGDDKAHRSPERIVGDIVISHVHDADAAYDGVRMGGKSCASCCFSVRLERQSAFPDLLADLDRCPLVKSFGVDMPTLEEVFVRLISNSIDSSLVDVASASADGQPSHRSNESAGLIDGQGALVSNGIPGGGRPGATPALPGRIPSLGRLNASFSSQTAALVKKRYLNGRRSPKMLILQGVIPTLMMCTLISIKASSPPDVWPAAVALAAPHVFITAFTYVPVVAVLSIVEDKETGCDHLQIMNGARVKAYWTANLFFDMILYLIPLAGAFVVCVVLLVPEWKGRVLGYIFMLLLANGPGIFTFAYLISHAFKTTQAAQTWTFTLLISVSNLVQYISYFLLPAGLVWADALRFVLVAIIPNFGLSSAFVYLHQDKVGLAMINIALMLGGMFMHRCNCFFGKP